MQTLKNRKGLFTYICPETNNMHVKLYNTLILRQDNKGNIILNSDGFRTRHTKNCINDFTKQLGIRVYQKDNEWYVQLKNDTIISFEDNMKIEL